MQQKSSRGGWSPESLTGYWVNRTSRAILRYGDRILAPYGFSLSQLPVLHALATSAGRSTTDLARLARVEQPTMTEMVERMKKAGIVKTRPNPEDRRGTIISLTPTAWPRFAAAREALAKAEADAMGPLTAAERETLRGLLQRVTVHVEEVLDAVDERKEQP